MPKRIAQGAKKTAPKKAVDPDKAELADRIGQAFKEFNAKARRGTELSQEEFAAAVSRELGLRGADAYSQTAASRWMSVNDPATPPNKTIKAIAKVLNANLLWLLVGASED